MRSRVLRMSGLDRAAICPASAAYDVQGLRVESEASALGVAWHQAAAEHVEGEPPTDERLAEIARAHEIEDAALQELWALGESALPRPGEGRAEVEVRREVGGVQLVGHVDWIGPVQRAVADWTSPDGAELAAGARWAVVRDWKTGHPPHHAGDRPLERWVQGHLYALAVRDLLHLDAVLVERHWVRLGQDGIEGRWIAGSRWESVERWLGGVLTRAVEAITADEGDRIYRPVDTWTGCRGCAGRTQCPAYRERMHAVRHVLDVDLENPTPESIREAWRALEGWSSLQAAVRDARRAITRYLTEHGPVPLEDGLVLTTQAAPRGGAYPVVRRLEPSDVQDQGQAAGPF